MSWCAFLLYPKLYLKSLSPSASTCQNNFDVDLSINKENNNFELRSETITNIFDVL